MRPGARWNGDGSEGRDWLRILAGATLYELQRRQGTLIHAQHWTELRAAVGQARAVIAAPAMVFSGSSLSSLPVKAIHVQELMDAVK